MPRTVSKMLFSLALIGLVVSVPLRLHAQAIQLTIADTTAKKADLLLIPIRVSALSTTDSVYSGQFSLSFNSGVLSVYGIETAGTMMQSVGNVLFNATTQQFAFASTSVISGSGVFVYLKVAVQSSPSALTDSIRFTSASFNEGRPSISRRNGYFRILTLTLAPKSPPSNLVVGDSVQFSVSGDQLPPLIWSTSSNSVATIDGNGKMRAVGVGQAKVFVQDARGLKDSSNLFPVNSALLKSLTTTIHDTSITQTLSFNLPIYISDVTSLGIISGSFTLGFNGAILQAVDVITAGSMTSSWSAPAFSTSSGRIDVALAGTQSLSGSGILAFVRFRVPANASGSTAINFSNVIFNETINANVVSGTFYPLAAPSVVITPSSAVLTRGDTLTFRVTSGGTAPYVWSSTNSTVASINASSGFLTALNRGTTSVSVVDNFGFTATTGSIVVNDIRVSLPDTSVGLADSIDVPLNVENLTGLGILAYEMRITYDSTVVRFGGLVNAGTMSSGFTMTVKDTLDTLRVASAGSSALTGAGTLLKLRFKPAAGATLNQFSNLSFVSFRFNEPSPSTPTASPLSGRISIGNLPPGAPLAVAATTVTTTGFTANWNTVASSTGYRLDVSADIAFGAFVAGYQDLSVAGTAQAVTGLTSNTLYYYRVRAVGTGGTSPNSNIITVTTLVDPPATPGLVSPVDLSTGVPISLTLSWNASSGASTYTVQVSTAPDFSSLFLNQSGIGGTSLFISGLSNSSQYFWHVSATNTGGTSPFSTAFSFTTVIAPPAAPALDQPLDGAVNVTTTPTLSWIASPNATSYNIQVSTDINFTPIALVVNQSGITGVSFTTLTLANSTTYYWHVSATNAGGTSASSTARSFTTILGAPTATAATNITSTGFTANWSAVSGATSFRLDVATDAGFTSFVSGYQDLVLGNVISQAVTGLTATTTYYYRVRAANAGGTTSNSNSITVTTLAPPSTVPSAPLLDSPADNALNVPLGSNQSVILSWFSAASATSYTLQVSTDTLFTLITFSAPSVTTSNFTVTNLQNGTKYFWRVSASNVNGTSSFSEIRRFTTIPAPPAVPTLVLPNDAATGISITPTLSWGAAPRATTYRLQVSKSVSFAPTVFDDSTLVDTTKQVGPLANDTTYFWRVQSKNAGGTSTFSPSRSFRTILGPPTLISVTPNTGNRRDTLTIILAGTNFVFGATVNFGSGVTIRAVSVDTSTRMTVRIQIDSVAAAGSRDVTVTNPLPGGLSATLTNGFTVMNPVPTLVSILPTSGARLQSLSVTFNGANFSAGATSVNFGDGVTVNSVSVTNATQLTTNISISAGATIGTRDVSVVNASPGGGAATLSNAFTVVNPLPLIALVSPNSIGRGSRINVLVKGAYFIAGITTVSFGADIVINSTAVSESTLTANISISAAAAVGSRDIVVSNASPGGGSATLFGAFTVNTSLPTEITGYGRALPRDFLLSEAFPNPFNPSTTIWFGVPEQSAVKIEIVNILGKSIVEIIHGEVHAGNYRAVWNGSNQPSGVYLVRMEAHGMSSSKKYVASRKIVLTK